MNGKAIRGQTKTYYRNARRFWDREVKAIDVTAGAAAYRLYADTIRNIAKHYGEPFDLCVDAFVTLFPRNKLWENFRCLATVIVAKNEGWAEDQISVTTFRNMALRAIRYLDGSERFDDRPRGAKITAFRDNLLHIEKSRQVTIDGHMVSICVAEDLTMSEAVMKFSRNAPAPHYAEMSAAIKKLAIEERLPPCYVQAILWNARRRAKTGQMFPDFPEKPVPAIQFKIFPRKEQTDAA